MLDRVEPTLILWDKNLTEMPLDTGMWGNGYLSKTGMPQPDYLQIYCSRNVVIKQMQETNWKIVA